MSGADFAALLPAVARRLLGDPPRIGADEWRYGSHGSLSVHPARGTWHDFEADEHSRSLDLRTEECERIHGAGLCMVLAGRQVISEHLTQALYSLSPRTGGGRLRPPLPT